MEQAREDHHGGEPHGGPGVSTGLIRVSAGRTRPSAPANSQIPMTRTRPAGTAPGQLIISVN